jgi:hypothetical protein
VYLWDSQGPRCGGDLSQSAAAKTRLKAAVTELEALTQEVQTAGLKISGRFEEITGRSPMDTSKVGTVSHAGGTSYAAILSINRYFDNVLDIMERRRRELIDQVHAICAEKSAMLTEQMDANSIYVTRNYSVCFNTKRCMEEESAVYFLEHESELLSGISRQMALHKNISTIPATSSNICFTASTDGGIEDTTHNLGNVIAVEIDACQCELLHAKRLRGGVVNDEISLSLQLADRRGQRISEGGHDVSHVMRSLMPCEKVMDGMATVVDCSGGTYNVMVRFDTTGSYAMQLLVEGAEIAGSPFCFTVSHSSSGSSRRRMLVAVDEKGSRDDDIGSGSRVVNKGKGETGAFHKPYGICCDNSLVYFSDCISHCVQVYHCDGTFVRSIGQKGHEVDQLYNPYGVCCDSGLLYVADSGNHRVQVFRLMEPM